MTIRFDQCDEVCTRHCKSSNLVHRGFHDDGKSGQKSFCAVDSTIEHAVRFSGMSARCERQRSARARAASVALVDASAHALVVRCVCIEGAELGWRAQACAQVLRGRSSGGLLALSTRGIRSLTLSRVPLYRPPPLGTC